MAKKKALITSLSSSVIKQEKLQIDSACSEFHGYYVLGKELFLISKSSHLAKFVENKLQHGEYKF